MLLGENAVGKSSILQAIAVATMSIPVRRAAGVVRKNLLPVTNQVGATSDLDLLVKIDFDDEDYNELTLHHRGYNLKGRPRTQILGYGARRFFVSGKHASTKSSRNRTLFDESASLPDPALWLLKAAPEKFEAAARALHSLLSLGVEEYVTRDSEGVYVKSLNSLMPIGCLSDGYKTIFALSVDIMRELLLEYNSLEFAQGVVLIDEIENHLHPRWKLRLMTSLRQAMPKVQFISSTHDPLCLRGMSDGEVQVLHRDDRNEICTVPDLPPISSLRVEQILTSEYFGLASTEDPTQESAVNILAKYSGRPDSTLTDEERGERDTALYSYAGTSRIGSSVDRQIMAEALSNHVKNYANKSFIDKSKARKESVRIIMDVLERAIERDQG
jgi:hypothetical protein